MRIFMYICANLASLSDMTLVLKRAFVKQHLPPTVSPIFAGGVANRHLIFLFTLTCSFHRVFVMANNESELPLEQCFCWCFVGVSESEFRALPVAVALPNFNGSLAGVLETRRVFRHFLFFQCRTSTAMSHSRLVCVIFCWRV